MKKDRSFFMAQFYCWVRSRNTLDETPCARMMLPTVTSGDGVIGASEAHDAVILLREWGTDRLKVLPHAPYNSWTIGTSKECDFRIMDRYSSPKHAIITREYGRWWIRDLGTPLGLRQDGIPRREFVLTPGVEIGIGATVVIAESVRSVALREFCRRLLGWGGDRIRAVDQALRAIRLAVAHRSPLVLCGEEDMAAIAHMLHGHTLGDRAPFIVCDRRRGNTDASVRSPASAANSVEAFSKAAGGSVCIRYSRLPEDVDELMNLLFAPESEVQLFVGMNRLTSSEILTRPMTMYLPPLQIREMEVPRIIDEYAAEAIGELKAPPDCFDDDDRRWMLANSARSLSEIEKGTLRIVALKTSPSTNAAATRLGMTCTSLNRWLAHRAPVKARIRRVREARSADAASQARSRSAPP